MSKLLVITIHSDESMYEKIYFYCPGCLRLHRYEVRVDGLRPSWRFNGNLLAPTFTPSLLYPDAEYRCHLTMTDGQIKYHEDCHHNLKGQTVPLGPPPEAWDRYGLG